MDRVWNNSLSDGEDFYKLLGCDESSTMDQINAEYKTLARDLHPDKNPNDPNAAEKFSKIQKARDILVNESSRADYDKWRRSGLTISYDMWLAAHGSTHVSLHWALKKKPQLALEDSCPGNSSQDISYITQEDYSPSLFKPQQSYYHDFGWQRDSNELLTKFRSYQI
ncbi:DnaJ-like subfamily C member 12 [Holothuria leucospilota]|uniref:DnaJ-like subfamily C member 12 n=1 Tax=Holothuria leucospilota TaxID=206669 RepID=A0A9Q1BEW9_HOLLE|nr:DnaJ-like subfamily C member 12 [Holothuria leucospilota]